MNVTETFLTILLATMATTSSVTTLYLLYRVKHLEKRLEETMKTKQQHGRTRPADLDKKILELWSRGYSLRQIAREVGVSHSTVYRRLKKILEKIEPPTTEKKEISIEA